MVSITLGSPVTFEYFPNFNSLFKGILLHDTVIRHKLWCPLKSIPFNITRLYLTLIVLALISAVYNRSNIKLIFHDFAGPTIKFPDFPGLENDIFKCHDFPCFPWPVGTLKNKISNLGCTPCDALVRPKDLNKSTAWSEGNIFANITLPENSVLIANFTTTLMDAPSEVDHAKKMYLDTLAPRKVRPLDLLHYT